ncbi:MAG TPA: acyltransferase [Segetibacter sp.]
MLKTPAFKLRFQANAVEPTKERKTQKVFFPNLDGLRFICFLFVFLFHSYKTIFQNIKSSATTTDNVVFSVVEFLFRNGELGVNFFFVLSGFLITYLLIKEQETTRKIHLRNFYLRRILRIWPLFYLCVFIGFVIVPFLKSSAGGHPSEVANPLYYIFFLNNFDYIQSWPNFPDALILIVLWSVAVEEQFYLIWPLLLKYLPKRTYPILFGSIIGATLLFRSFHNGHDDHDFAIRNFHTLSVIGDMALGGLMAFYCSYDSKFLWFIKNLSSWKIYALYAGTFACILFRETLFNSPGLLTFERLILALFFGLVILEQNFSKNSFYKFSNFKVMSKLGLYTYSLYCLHFFIISVVQSGLGKIGIGINNSLMTCIVTIVTLAAVLSASILCYKFVEMPFLKLKDRFAFVKRN